MEVNLTGPFLLCQAFGRRMLVRGTGSIVNIASVAGLLGVADRVAYNASKHGLIGMTRTLAVEWGGRGIRVNAVCPGWVKTEMDDESQASGAYATPTSPTMCRWRGSRSRTTWPRRSRSSPTRSVSGFINGAALSVDGGWSADGSWQSLRLDTPGTMTTAGCAYVRSASICRRVGRI